MKFNRKKILFVIFLLAVLARFSMPYIRETYYFHSPFIRYGNDFVGSVVSDSIGYNDLARSLMRGNGFAFNLQERDKAGENFDLRTNLDIFKENGLYWHKAVPPVYPLFLATVYFLFGINTLAYFIPQTLLGALTCCLIYLIAEELFNNKVAIMSGLMLAFYPDLVFWTYMIRTETLFIFLLVFVFWLLLKKGVEQNYLYAVVIGIVIGLACLTRITIFYFIPIIVVWKYLSYRENRPRVFLWLLILLISLSATLLPWAVRNYILFNHFTVITDEAGTIFLDYPNHPFSPDTASSDFKNKSYLQLLINFIWNNPGEFIVKTINRFFKYLSPFTPPMRGLAKVYKGVSWLFVMPASFIGLILSAKKYWKTASLLILFVLYYILLHSVTFVDDGLVYRYPIQPFLCIFAACGYWWICPKCKRMVLGLLH